MSESLPTALQEFRDDRRSNTVELATRAASLVMEFCDRWEGGDTAKFQSELAALCRRLIALRPGVAASWNLANEVLNAAEKPGVIYQQGSPQPATPAQAASNAAFRFLAFLAHHERRIANEMLPYIHSGSLLLTHSYSLTVLAAFVRAREAGKRFGVVCTQSAIMNGGFLMARGLAAAGIEVEMISDAAAAVFIHGFYTLVIGADYITSEGVINRVGTLGMALAAKSLGIPVYCLAGSEKFLPHGAVIPIPERDPTEIVPSEPNLKGFNIYHDLTPLALISRFFTEDGPLSADEAAAKLLANPLHSLLHDSPA